MNEITVSNLPDLGIEPYKRFDENSFLTSVLYYFPNNSTLLIEFDEEGDASRMSYNGQMIPSTSQLELIDGRLHIILPIE